MLSEEWTKAKASDSSGGCVTARFVDGMVEVMDSKDPSAPVQSYTRHEWECHLDGVKKGEFDLPN